MDNTFENRLQAIEYELSQIAESEYLEELKKKFNNESNVDVVVNIIPSRDISFKTRSLLSSILDRLELNRQDRLDLEKYIIYGGGENIEYLKQTLAIWIEWKDKITNILEGSPEEFDSLIEIFNYIDNHIKESNIKLEELNNKISYSPFEKGSSENSAVLKGGNNYIGENDVEVNIKDDLTEGFASCAEGQANVVLGNSSHAEGIKNKIFGKAGHAEGFYNIIRNNFEHAQGKYNKSNTGTIHSVGIGEDDNTRKNAHEIDNDGNNFFYGVGGYDGTNPTPGVNDLKSILSNNTSKDLNIFTVDDAFEEIYESENPFDSVGKIKQSFIDKIDSIYDTNYFDTSIFLIGGLISTLTGASENGIMFSGNIFFGGLLVNTTVTQFIDIYIQRSDRNCYIYSTYNVNPFAFTDDDVVNDPLLFEKYTLLASAYYNNWLEDSGAYEHLKEYIKRFKKNFRIYSDWNARDSEETGYVENRTHYYSYNTIKGFGEHEYHNDEFRFRINSLFSKEYVISNETVTINIGSSQRPIYVNITHDSNTNTVGLYDNDVILYTDVHVQQLSEEFIPDTIARKKDINVANESEILAIFN